MEAIQDSQYSENINLPGKSSSAAKSSFIKNLEIIMQIIQKGKHSNPEGLQKPCSAVNSQGDKIKHLACIDFLDAKTQNLAEDKQVSTELQLGFDSFTSISNPTQEKAKIEEVSTELKLGFDYNCIEQVPKKTNPHHHHHHHHHHGDHDQWTIKRKLRLCDVGLMSRLHLSTNSVNKHVLALWDSDTVSKVNNGVRVDVWDCDTMSQHHLVFKQSKHGGNVLMKNWNRDFIKRRNLKQGDEIGLYWDSDHSRFNFSVLQRLIII